MKHPPREVDHRVIDPELIRRAEAAGITTTYENWQHQRVDVPPQTLEAILAALAQAAPTPAAPPTSAHAGVPLTSAEADAPVPGERHWGFTVQLYSVRSRDSWGHGDLRDLAELAAWSAQSLEAGFVLVNPLHAAEPSPPVSASPYLPMTRRYASPLYLRIEDIPEYAQLSPEQRDKVQRMAEPLRARNATADLIDRDAVWTAKRAALELIYQLPLTHPRQAAFDEYRQREGAELTYWASWCALAEQHGPDWRAWPAPLRDRDHGLAQTAATPGLARAAGFHAWLQWLVDQQLAGAQQAARDAGMAHGIIHDLAVGVHPGGADAWAHQDLLVSGVSVGAPPDSFNQLGQDWMQPPWHPQRLAATGYRPLAELFAATLRNAGGLRIDHVMGLSRLWWVPAGTTADRGAYVRYDLAAAVAGLTGQAARTGAVAIGEDLGTVEEATRGYLAAHGVLGTTMLWFAEEPDGTPLRPEHWRRACMATVGTHDVPPIAGFLSGDQVRERARLHLLTGPEEDEQRRSAELVSAWRDLLVAHRLLVADRPATLEEFTVAVYGFLARTPALLVGVSLADAVGDTRSQNIPGTSDQYPNWRIPLCDQAGRAVLLEELPALPLVKATARAASPR
jgi:4-alpha-glucanotransferase